MDNAFLGLIGRLLKSGVSIDGVVHPSLNGILTLRRAQDVQMVWRQQAPEPYRPGTGCYLEDVDW